MSVKLPGGWLIPFLALLATGSYLAWSYGHGLLGFPLDDAWIHQTYARNLAQSGQLAYLPGQPSAGSTSPAWSFMLSVSYLLGLDFRLWAYLLGGLSLAATAWLAYRLLRRLAASERLRDSTSGSLPMVGLLAGFLCAVEWHLVWAAVSGMETMLFTALSLAMLETYVRHAAAADRQSLEQTISNAVLIGLTGGILTLTRPEGLGLTGLILLAMLAFPLPQKTALRWSEIKSRLLTAAIALLACGAILAPYIAFNLSAAGSVFPNTFYAKQAEYRPVVEALSAPGRFWRVLSPTLVGAQVLLLPGFLYAAYRLIRQRRWPALLPLAWWLATLSMYALRLPVNYQHGRYTMPSIPLLILYGVWGTADLLRPRSPHLAVRVLSRAAALAVAVLALLFLGRGTAVYHEDVGFIEGEMVATAHWLNEHTAPGDLIAVHDIGAVGYLTDRPLLDLAGLITPEVIPFIGDARQLAEWMGERGAAYAVFFPDFSSAYEQLAADPRFEARYCTGYAWTRSRGRQNMCVYHLADGKHP